MSEQFGASALRLCGISARQLGWRPAEFWMATPAELATALAPETSLSLGRDDLVRLMEQDDARPGN